MTESAFGLPGVTGDIKVCEDMLDKDDWCVGPDVFR